MAELRFYTADYLVMGAVLAISLGIGFYFGLIKKQRTPEEYLLGNRQMKLLPVALSMIVTYQSAVSVIGIPTEIYLYHTMYLYSYIGYTLCILVQFLTIVPLMHPLRLNSAYEVCRTLIIINILISIMYDEAYVVLVVISISFVN